MSAGTDPGLLLVLFILQHHRPSVVANGTCINNGQRIGWAQWQRSAQQHGEQGKQRQAKRQAAEKSAQQTPQHGFSTFH